MPKFVKIIYSDWFLNLFKITGHALLGFLVILLKPGLREGQEKTQICLNHELIHIEQQRELLIVLFYLLYTGYYIWNRLKLKMNHNDAYMNIPFEKEAYANQANPLYLEAAAFPGQPVISKRKMYAYWR